MLVMHLQDTMSDETRKVWIEPDEEVDVDGGRGTANFVMKWKDSGRQCNVSIVEDSLGELDEEGSGVLITFECRNCEIETWHPSDGYVVVSEGGKEFENVAFEDGEWVDYDDENDCSVGISDLTCKIIQESKKGGKKKGGKRRKKK